MIVIGCDHTAVDFKRVLIRALSGEGYEFLDVGTDKAEACDYPDYAKKACDEILKNTGSLGILICGTGIGISIAANKIKGIRCALCSDAASAAISRQHNDANVLAMGCRVLGIETAIDIAEAFLAAEFSGEERHIKRVEKIKSLEKNN